MNNEDLKQKIITWLNREYYHDMKQYWYFENGSFIQNNTFHNRVISCVKDRLISKVGLTREMFGLIADFYEL